MAHALEKNRNLILEAERHIWEQPETGYREYETSNYLANKFEGKNAAEVYKKMAEKTKKSFNEKFYNKKRKSIFI